MKRLIGALVAVGFAVVMLADLGSAEHEIWVAVTTMPEETFRILLSGLAIAIAVLIVAWDRLERRKEGPPPVVFRGGDGGAGGGASAGAVGIAFGGQGGGGGGVGLGATGGEGGESGYMEFRRRYPDLVNPLTDELLMQAGTGGRGGGAPRTDETADS